jgi:hypothetical protein
VLFPERPRELIKQIPSETYNEFLVGYHQKLFDLVQTLRQQQDEATPYLVISAGGQRYVQCMLVDKGTKARCEGASGLLGPERRITLSKKQRRIIASLGFTLNPSSQNYAREIEIGEDEGGLWNMTDLMLEMMYRIYETRVPLKIIHYP